MWFLIVEDQEGPLEALEYAVRTVVPRYCPYFEQNGEFNYNVTQHYNGAEQLIEKGCYNFILLDHRLPLEDVGNLENEDMTAFSACLRDIGYGLIPKIREKCSETIIVGTSSIRKEELKSFSSPDYTMGKMWSDAPDGLAEILEKNGFARCVADSIEYPQLKRAGIYDVLLFISANKLASNGGCCVEFVGHNAYKHHKEAEESGWRFKLTPTEYRPCLLQVVGLADCTAFREWARSKSWLTD